MRVSPEVVSLTRRLLPLLPIAGMAYLITEYVDATLGAVLTITAIVGWALLVEGSA